MMTRCVVEAWEIIDVIRSFRCLGISLPIDGLFFFELEERRMRTTGLGEFGEDMDSCSGIGSPCSPGALS